MRPSEEMKYAVLWRVGVSFGGSVASEVTMVSSASIMVPGTMQMCSSRARAWYAAR